MTVLPRAMVELGGGSVSEQHLDEEARYELTNEISKVQRQRGMLKEICERHRTLVSRVDPLEVNAESPVGRQILGDSYRHQSECDSYVT